MCFKFLEANMCVYTVYTVYINSYLYQAKSVYSWQVCNTRASVLYMGLDEPQQFPEEMLISTTALLAPEPLSKAG